jgi:anti-sigma factor RsiW
MCDVQAKLIAWLDRELPKDEAIAVERHIEGCGECRSWVTAYEQVSETFDAYCDAVMARKAPRQVPRWVPVLAGAVVAATVICLAFLRTRGAPPAVIVPTAAIASAPVPGPSPEAEPRPALKKPKIRRQRLAPRIREFATPEQTMDAAIEIAIPAEAMFPPGVMPNGISFIANMRIAPDGSVRQVYLRQ